MAVLDDVKLRLASFGVTTATSDDWVLGFIVNKVEAEIVANCNVSIVPAGLLQVEVDRICAEYMRGKKSTGQLTGINMDATIKSIQEGDTNISYNIDMTPEQKIDALITHLMHADVSYAAYRCIRW